MKQILIFICLAILLTLSACGGETQAAGVSTPEVAAQSQPASAGQELFARNCSTCHGADGAGLKGLGKPLIASSFINEESDEALLAFLKVGRPISDPLNTTRVAMPAKGGNPALTDEQLLTIIGYIRSIQ